MMRSISYITHYFILTITLGDRSYSNPHFTDEETETQED